MYTTETPYTQLWQSKLGLLPIKLYHESTDQQKFIMLNGISNNFCLDIDNNNELNDIDYWSQAWSSDVGSFIRIANGRVKIYNWGKQTKNEEYDEKIVFSRIDNFYKYIGSKQIPKENSIVPFTTNIFRSLRNEFGETGKAELSLKAFLYMLKYIEEEDSSVDDLELWGLNGIDNVIQSTLEPYIYELKKGIGYYDLVPNMSLILRHASGRLFQEAHYLATLDRQRTIWGIASSNINTQPEKYSTVHFTPAFVARSIVEEVLDTLEAFPLSLKIFDPAMGSGEFLKEILRQLKNRNYNGHVTVVGWDISIPAIDMAKFVLAFEKKEWGNNLTIDLKVVENSLLEDWGDDFDIVLMNPPFISWELLKDEQQREIIRNVLGKNYQKNPNIASAFFWKATKALKLNGVLGCVLPSSILNADSYKILRSNIKDLLVPRLIAKLGNYVFQNAFTDACFYVGHRNIKTSNTKIVWTYNVANATTDALRASRKLRFNKATIFNEDDYSVYYSDVPHENWMPLSYRGLDTKRKLEREIENKRLDIVKNVFDVKQGARIGNPIFVVNNEYLLSLPNKERRYFRPVSQNKNIINGKLSTIDYLFYPNTDKLESIIDEESLKKCLPAFYEAKLYPHREGLEKRATYSNWWSLSRDRAWQRKKEPKLISTEFGKAGSFAYDKTGDFVVERGCAWIPKKKENFSEDVYYSYLAIFCCEFFNELLGIYSKQIGGGAWWYLSQKYTSEIPIPDLTLDFFRSSGEFESLSFIGRKLSEGLDIDRSELKRIVMIIYGIS